MKDVVIILLFWAMVLAPCMVAMNTGAHLYEEDQEAEDMPAMK